MPRLPDKQLSGAFEKMLGQQLTESKYQSFLEAHPEFLMRPFLLNHQLHFNLIVSQFRMNTKLTADFCYLTKSSYKWHLILGELERPNIRLFLKNKQRLIPTAEFAARLAQIDEWRDTMASEGRTIVQQLDVLRKPSARNQVQFKYVLIIGRDESKERPEVSDRINQLDGNDLRILTFDSLLRHFERGDGRTCNVITLNKGKVRFKYLHTNWLGDMLDYITPSDLLFNKSDERKFAKNAFPITEWIARRTNCRKSALSVMPGSGVKFSGFRREWPKNS